jgi:hypothetical protein
MPRLTPKPAPPTNDPLASDFAPPAALRRPCVGAQQGDALNIARVSDATGGGKSPKAYRRPPVLGESD